MKLVLTIFVALLSTQAFAQSQTDDCGKSVAEVRQIMQSKFLHAFPNPEQTANAFIGTWISESGSSKFTISEHKKFDMNGFSLMVCPQENGKLYAYAKHTAGLATTYIAIGNKGSSLRLIERSGLFVGASDKYARAGSEFAKTFVKGH